jgi:putative flippase GtrA
MGAAGAAAGRRGLMLKRLQAVGGTKGEALRFGVVGVLTAGVDFGLLSAGVALGASYYGARVISVAVAMVAAWWLNRSLTFASDQPPSWREFLHYAGTAAAGALINYAIYSVLIYLGLPLWLAFCAGTGVAAVFNFLRYRVLLSPRSPPGDSS